MRSVFGSKFLILIIKGELSILFSLILDFKSLLLKENLILLLFMGYNSVLILFKVKSKSSVSFHILYNRAGDGF